jgi:hypothetical protein
MRVWVEDLKYHLVMALRAVGVGLMAVAWASALTSEAQQPTDTRAYIQLVAALVALAAVHLLTRLPPSMTVTDLIKPMERDIRVVAREHSVAESVIRRKVEERIRGGANIPRDRRRWLSSLAETYQAGDELQVDQACRADA